MAQYCVHGEEDCIRCATTNVQAPTIHLHIILDISPSMAARWSQTIGGLNEYIAGLRNDEAKYLVTITQFGLEHEVQDLYTDADLDSVSKFDEKNFQPNGHGTALWGAVGKSLTKINTNDPVLFVVITDGEENSSATFTSADVNKLIEDRQKLGNYTFAYLGVAKEAWGNEAKVRAFAASSQNMTAQDYDIGTYRSLTTLTSSYSCNMIKNASVGAAMNVQNFFSPTHTADETDEDVVQSTTSGCSGSTWTASH